jgi:hypothetical protein
MEHVEARVKRILELSHVPPPDSPFPVDEHFNRDFPIDASDDSESDDDQYQPSRSQFSRKTRTCSPSAGVIDLTSPNHSQRTSSPTCSLHGQAPESFSRKDSDDDDDEDSDQGGDGDDGDSVDGNEDPTDNIESRRHKFRNDEIDEVVNMFQEFQEEKLKPCAKRLGCTVSRLMRIGKWELKTPERRLGGNPWNAYLNHLKGVFMLASCILCY